jgi:hypothetical protein
MEKNNQRKVYQKPSWQKQEMFERFSMACPKITSPCNLGYNKQS